MEQHKWHKEIKAWADGGSIEESFEKDNTWMTSPKPEWNSNHLKFRIKQPKKLQHLFVHQDYKTNDIRLSEFAHSRNDEMFIGRIKLDTELK